MNNFKLRMIRTVCGILAAVLLLPVLSGLYACTSSRPVGDPTGDIVMYTPYSDRTPSAVTSDPAQTDGPGTVTDVPSNTDNVPGPTGPAAQTEQPTEAPKPTLTPGPAGTIPDNSPVYGSAESFQMVPIQGEEESVYCVTLDENKEYWDCPVSKIGHIFVHNLVAFPELDLAVNPNSKWQDWNNTTVEYVRLLESVYAKNYILIDANYIFNYEYRDGKLIANLKSTVKLPKGKTGLIISCDNVCFPEDEHGSGRVDKIAVYNGKIASYTKFADGSEEYSYERDVCDITEQFCLKHPDFSFAGARLMLAVSGYSGILGYRTDSSYAAKGFDVAKEREECMKVIDYLKSHGFYFGCHSYAHLDINTLSGSKLDNEFEKWNTQVKTLIGYTPFYIYPFGNWTESDTEQYRRLVAEGFHVMYGTSMQEILVNGTYKNRQAGNIYGERFIYCGKTMILYADKGYYDKYGDAYELYDNEGRYTKLYR